MTPIRKVTGIGPALAGLLEAKGILTAEHLAKASPETLQCIPRVGVQRASGLLVAAQKIVAGSESDQNGASPAALIPGTEGTSPVADDAPELQTKKGKKAAAKLAKKAAKLEKSARKQAEKVEKSGPEKAAKNISAKAAKAASEKKIKPEKAKKKKAAKVAKAKTKKARKAKAEKPTKTKKKSQSKKK